MSTNRRFGCATILLGAAALAGMYYWWTLAKVAGDAWPVANQPGTLASAAGRLKQEIAALRETAGKIPEAKKRREETRTAFAFAASALHQDISPDQLVDIIRKEAVLAGVTFRHIDPAVTVGRSGGRKTVNARNGPQSGGIEEWRFTLTVGGSYDRIAVFANRIEEFNSGMPSSAGGERFFQIHAIDITAGDDSVALLGANDAGNGEHRCDMTILTYRYTGAL